MADTWTLLSGYTASDYVDTMVFEVVSATKKIRPLSGQTLVAGEKNSQYVRFEMDRFWDGIDISTKNFSITYSLAGKYYGTSEAVSAEVSTDKLRFGWIVPEEACCIAGTLMFVLVIKSDGYVLKTQIAETPVVKSLDEESVVPEPTREAWYREFQTRVQEDLNDSQAALTSAHDALTRANTANDAASSALTAASEANLAAQDAIEVAKIRYGSPLVANAGPEMVDTNRVYVFTGSESAYTYGHWYYYDNGVWNDGGVYNGNSVNTDKTLSIENMPADAKATGDKINELKEGLNAIQSATASDVGKALKVKTVTDGKVVEWEFGETGVAVDSTLTIEGKAADAKATGDAIGRLDQDVNGEKTAISFESVDGVLFRENGTKFEAQASYITYYFPIEKGKKYQLSFQKTDSNSISYHYAVTDAVPAVGVSGTYIGTTLIPSRGTGSYEYTATTNGYFAMCRWRSGHTVINTGIGTSGGLDLRVASLEEQIVQAEQTSSDLADLEKKLDGKTVTIEKGIYWVGSPVIGTTTESNLNHETNNNKGKCTVLSLPANKLLRIVGVGLSNSTRLYFTCDVATGMLIDMSDSSDQLKLQAHYLCYDRNVRVYINCSNAYDHFIQIVDDTSVYSDISKVYGTTQGSILELNGKATMYNALKNIKKAKYGWRNPVTFLHFSDLHGDKTNLQRIMDFATDGRISPYIDNIIHSGDLVTVSLDDGLDFFDAISGSENILLVAGNHDVATGTGSNVDYSGATPEDTYNALFKDRIGNWGVTQPADGAINHLGYYYKDYSASKLRVIFLNPNHGTEYITSEITWFEDVLQSAYNSGYAVMCVEHYAFPSASCSIVNCSFSPRDGFGGGFAGWELPPTFVNAVETFIGYGGEFVAWLCGHGHQDHVLLHNNGHQFCIAVSTATYNRQRTLISDEYRDLGTKSQDLFNIVSVDTQAKTISILRVGADLTRLMNSKKHLCIDYANRTVVWND